jgi:hypothetical protein
MRQTANQPIVFSRPLTISILSDNTPTWETGGYTVNDIFTSSGSGTVGAFNPTGATDMTALAGNNLDTSSTAGLSLTIDLFNAASTTLYKTYQFTESFTEGGSYLLQTGDGFWASDTNPITAIRATVSGAGTIASGTCSLYGMN